MTNNGHGICFTKLLRSKSILFNARYVVEHIKVCLCHSTIRSMTFTSCFNQSVGLCLRISSTTWQGCRWAWLHWWREAEYDVSPLRLYSTTPSAHNSAAPPLASLGCVLCELQLPSWKSSAHICWVYPITRAQWTMIVSKGLSPKEW